MALSKCPACGGPLSDTLNKCIHCGAAVKKCPECAVLSSEDSAFCKNCGFRFGLPSAELTEKAIVTPVKKPEGKKNSEAEPMQKNLPNTKSAKTCAGDGACRKNEAMGKYETIASEWRKTLVGRIASAVNSKPLWGSRKLISSLNLLVLAVMIGVCYIFGGDVIHIVIPIFTAIYLLADLKEIIFMAFRQITTSHIKSFINRRGERLSEIASGALQVDIDWLKSTERRNHLAATKEVLTAAYFSEPLIERILYVAYAVFSLLCNNVILVAAYAFMLSSGAGYEAISSLLASSSIILGAVGFIDGFGELTVMGLSRLLTVRLRSWAAKRYGEIRTEYEDILQM